jgi:hypothetical protein
VIGLQRLLNHTSVHVVSLLIDSPIFLIIERVSLLGPRVSL